MFIPVSMNTPPPRILRAFIRVVLLLDLPSTKWIQQAKASKLFLLICTVGYNVAAELCVPSERLFFMTWMALSHKGIFRRSDWLTCSLFKPSCFLSTLFIPFQFTHSLIFFPLPSLTPPARMADYNLDRPLCTAHLVLLVLHISLTATIQFVVSNVF